MLNTTADQCMSYSIDEGSLGVQSILHLKGINFKLNTGILLFSPVSFCFFLVFLIHYTSDKNSAYVFLTMSQSN